MTGRFGLFVFVALLLAVPAIAGTEPVRVSLGFEPASVAPGESATGRVVFEIEPGYHIYGPLEVNGLPTRVLLKPRAGATVGEVRFPAPLHRDYEALGGTLALFEGRTVVEFPVRVGPEVSGDSLELEVQVDYQPCTDRVCKRPVQGLVVKGPIGLRRTAGREQTPSLVAGTDRAGGTAPAKAPRTNPFGDALDRGLLWALLAAFGWGLAASLSPCVYPMIPFTVSYFGGQSREGRGARRIGLAVAYVAGMSLTYAVLGVAAARLGQDLGSWMVNPWVIGALCTILTALACSMFGLYVLRLPPSVTNWFNAGDRGGYLEAAFMGLAMGFVAAPCVGPFAGSILVFVAQSGNLVLGFATLFTFGLGMGMLFLVLAVSSGSLARLPRSGQWMVRLEHFFGYAILGMALYLLSNVVPGWFSIFAAGVYLVLGGAALGAFTPLTAEAHGRAELQKGLGFLGVLVGSALVLAGLLSGGFFGQVPLGGPVAALGGDSAGEAGWFTSLDEALAEGQRAGKPVFADFRADWCIPCKLMERTTFREARVKEALEGFVRARLDCTLPDSPGARYKNQVLQVTSMPYLAFFDPRGRHLVDASIEGYAETGPFLEAVKRVAARFPAGAAPVKESPAP
ncbi:MAG: thioredoxin family protein [Candidatus Riflebacteria bacterium]|nr:thioredoxin family protein [Candidatus Riflebacteria bacterium]